ncbi:MAG: hypothetical protein ACE5GW_09790, partial [Planctomycetota bacterium]
MSLKDPLPPRFWTLIVALPLVLALAPTVARAQETESSDLRELEELIRSGDYDEAQEWLEEEDPGFAPLLRARLLRETGRGEEALTILEASSSYLEGAPAALIAAGALLSERGESKRAEELFRKAL